LNIILLKKKKKFYFLFLREKFLGFWFTKKKKEVYSVSLSANLLVLLVKSLLPKSSTLTYLVHGTIFLN